MGQPCIAGDSRDSHYLPPLLGGHLATIANLPPARLPPAPLRHLPRLPRVRAALPTLHAATPFHLAAPHSSAPADSKSLLVQDGAGCGAVVGAAAGLFDSSPHPTSPTPSQLRNCSPAQPVTPCHPTTPTTGQPGLPTPAPAYPFAGDHRLGEERDGAAAHSSHGRHPAADLDGGAAGDCARRDGSALPDPGTLARLPRPPGPGSHARPPVLPAARAQSVSDIDVVQAHLLEYHGKHCYHKHN